MYWALNSQIGKTPVEVKIPDHSTSFEKKFKALGGQVKVWENIYKLEAVYI